ncbi:membrane integrity-associated transporter subunit PqiC [bacterium]|nr:membrane integrity-associated transporter subunit PqiC [bacterium]MBU1994694.1 membrane integrity-associated transporter subunit PqiC [bacterium]
MIKIILAVMAIFLLTGCTTSRPPVTEYAMNVHLPKINLDKGVCAEKSIKIAHAFSRNNLISLQMHYALGEHKQFSYSESQWTDSPSSLVSLELSRFIRETNLFKNVQIAKSRTKSDWILETNIEDFMQYYNEDASSSYVNAVIIFTLIDTSNNRVIASKTFNSKIQTKSLDAEGGVKALNEALLNIFSQSAPWFGGVCK